MNAFFFPLFTNFQNNAFHLPKVTNEVFFKYICCFEFMDFTPKVLESAMEAPSNALICLHKGL